MRLTLTAKHDLAALANAAVAHEVTDADPEYVTIRLHHSDLTRLSKIVDSDNARHGRRLRGHDA